MPVPVLAPKTLGFPSSTRRPPSCPILDHHVWHLDILLSGILGVDLEDDVLLVTWDRFPRHGLKEAGHSVLHAALVSNYISSRGGKRERWERGARDAD